MNRIYRFKSQITGKVKIIPADNEIEAALQLEVILKKENEDSKNWKLLNDNE